MFAFIGIPATSALLFIVAGLLIGYLLWHRDRSADQRALKIAEQKAQQARHVARLRKAEFIDLRNALAARGQQDRTPAERRPEALSPSVAEERQAEDRQTIRDCRARIDQLSQIRDRLATANYELTRQRDDHSSELDQIRPQLEAVTQQYQDLQGRLEDTQREHAAAEHARSEQQSELDRLRQEHAKTGEVLEKTERELADVRNINEQLQAAIDEQTTEFEELTQRLADKAHVEEKLEEAQRDLQSLKSELESRDATIDEQRQALESSAEENRQLSDRIEALQPLPTRLREREAEVERLCHSLDQLESGELQPLRNQLARTSDELHRNQANTRQLVAELQQKTTAFAELQSRTQQMQEERNVLQRSNENLKGKLTDLTSSLDGIQQRLVAAEEHNQQTMAAQAVATEKMQRQAERIEKLQNEAQSAEAYRKKVAVFEAKVRQLTVALRQVGGEQQAGLGAISKVDPPANPSAHPEPRRRAA